MIGVIWTAGQSLEPQPETNINSTALFCEQKFKNTHETLENIINDDTDTQFQCWIIKLIKIDKKIFLIKQKSTQT